MWGPWWGFPGNLAPESISQLPGAQSVTLTDLAVLDQNNGNGTWTTRSATLQQISTLVLSSIPTPSSLPPVSIINTSSPFTITNAAGNVLLSGSGFTPINLFPASAALRPLFFKDYTGNAFTNNLNGTPYRIVPNGTEKIDGQTSVTITIDYQGIYLYPLPTGGWYVG